MLRDSHITACRISDANPSELVVSWSGDGIYLFDMNRSPSPSDPSPGRAPWDPEDLDRVKRNKNRDSAHSPEAGRRRKKARHHQTERETEVDQELEELLPGQSRIRIPGLVANLRRELFGLVYSTADLGNLEERRKSYAMALKTAAVVRRRVEKAIVELDRKDEEFFEDMREEPNSHGLRMERRNRSARAKLRRRVRGFVNAAGSVAWSLADETTREEGGEIMSVFEPPCGSGGMWEPFFSCFLTAVTTFLAKGVAGVVGVAEMWVEDKMDLENSSDDDDDDKEGEEGMGNQPEQSQPLHQDQEPPQGMVAVLNKYFDNLELEAPESVLRDVDDNEPLFESLTAAVHAFRRVVELRLTSPNPEELTSTTLTPVEFRFWGERFSRALVMQIGEGLNFETVESAFEGLDAEDVATEAEPSREEVYNAVDMLIDRDSDDDDDFAASEDEIEEEDDNDYDDDDDDEREREAMSSEANDGNHDFDSDDDIDPEDSDSDLDGGYPSLSSFLPPRPSLSSLSTLHPAAPVTEHTKFYTGHLNLRTVKDVNFFGANDEYVISGSDCGHVFIWDKKTTELVQLLHGDDDTVNITEGHPHQPLLAVSGIDSTVKIFDVDLVEQKDFGDREEKEGRATGVAGVVHNREGGNAYSGMATRRRMTMSEGIIERNGVLERRGRGGGGAVLTVSRVGVSFADWVAMWDENGG